MSIDQMRSALAEVFSGPRWKQRVINMSDAQVIAMYKSMKEEGRLIKHERSPSAR